MDKKNIGISPKLGNNYASINRLVLISLTTERSVIKLPDCRDKLIYLSLTGSQSPIY
jgi:hypothetical protein